MRKIFKIVSNVANLNDFTVVDEITLTRGNPGELCFQLFTVKPSPPGCTSDADQLIRYVPTGTDNRVQVFFDNINDDFDICRVATQKFTEDGSIWCINILPQDEFMFNGMRVEVTEDGVTCKFHLETDIATQDVGEREWFS